MPINSKDVMWIEEPEIGFWEATFLPAIAKGLKTTLGHITHYKPVTQQYPELRPELPQHYRGVHRLNRDEQGRVKCVACMLCATACPANCIAIEAAPAPPDWPDRDKFPADVRARRAALHLLRHVRRGVPGGCDRADAHLRPDGRDARAIWCSTSEKLLEIYDETKDNPKDPVRTGRGRLGPASEFARIAHARARRRRWCATTARPPPDARRHRPAAAGARRPAENSRSLGVAASVR